ncbi:lysine-specific demethylase 9 [Adelges cooleyi]|uniref:lysine-specific demethylase 9 n=1 Tax=Adelges cooleyi TaxID=133065 RepID=UPI00218095DF|nr:lysine-specific demethylase 9 [Adelges cooleyi]XP_050425544.1 lysine-specific demethylase 9 [Adelges cooleyi]XP_050425554.1 lysine-specific demethylase 9 [Adelges cooleyi]XP_050425562.1 lysine-specific demethylase 9 [Adelges cooleyi]XP_050425572.1 lysine-specific demethylase 9 [Adelges cooleyi]
MDFGYSNMLEKTRKYFQGIPTDGQLELPHQMHPHHPDANGRTAMNSEPSSAAAERFGYHPHMRYTYQPYSSPGHYPRTAVDPKPAAFQSQFQPPSTVFQKRQQLFLSTAAASATGPPSPYKSPYQQPQQQQQQHIKPPAAQQPQSSFKVTPPQPVPQQQQQQQPPPPPQHHQSPYKYAPSKPQQQSPYPPAPVPSPYTISKPSQSPFTVPKEQQGGVQPPTVPETPPPTPHSHYLNRNTVSSHSQALQDRDYLRFKPIQTPPKYHPLERPKSELPAGMVPITGGSQSSHLAIRYDPKLEQPRSGVRAVPIAQAKPAEANRVIVQKPEPLRYHRTVAADDKRPASVQPSYLESRPFQIKPYDGGSTSNNSSSSSSNNGGGGQQYHRPFAPQQPSTSASTDHRWNVFGRQDARTPVFQPNGAAINGFHQPASTSASPHHHQQTTSAVHLTPRQPQQQQQQQQPSPQQPAQIQNYPLNLQKTTLPVRLPVQITTQIKVTRENSSTRMSTLRFEAKRESPLDLSVKTVCRSADSTDDRIHPFGHDIPKVNFKPDFNVCRTTTPPVYQQTNSQQNYQQPLPPLPATQPQPPTSLSSADEAWRAAIDRQIEYKFNLYTSSKKQQLQQHSPAQADKRVLEILKQNIEARDASKPQIAEAPSTPAMVFSTPIRKEPSTTPLKKTDYYMTERTGTPFPKKIDYYMDRANCNAPRIKTKAERKQITTERSCNNMRISSPMAAATAISPHPFLPSPNATPPTKQEQIPPAQTQVAIDLKLEIKKEPSPIKDSELCLLNKDNVEKDNDDDEDFWMNTCNSFVSQLAETQDNKKVKSPTKRKVPKESKRKYTKRIKVEPVSGSEQDKLCEEYVEKPTENIKLELPQEKPSDEQKSKVDDVPKASTENERKSVFTDNIDNSKLLDIEEPVNENINDKRPKQKPHKNANIKPYRAVPAKYINRYLKKNEKEELLKKEKIKKQVEVKKEKKQLKVEKKELKKEVKIEKKDLKKGEKKDVKKEVKIERKKVKKDIKKEEKKDLKKNDKKDDKKDTKEEKKDVKNKEEEKKEVKKELRKETTTRKKTEKEHVTRNENTRKSDGKYNPRQSLRRKNSLKDYTYAFDELLDDAFAHFEEEKIPTKRRKKCSSPTPAPAVVTKKLNNKENDETLKMRLRSRSKPLAKQEPVKKKNAVKNIPKRRRKKSLGEKSLHTPDWKDELYKFKRSLRLPSKLISVVSAPTTGTVGADQVSLTSIMDISHMPPVKEPKVNSQVVGKKGLKNTIKRIGHLFGRRDVFKGRIKREKIVSAEKLMQRNLRKRRQENEKNDEVVNKEIVVDDSQLHEVIEEKPAAQIFFKRKLIRKKFRSGFDYIKKKKKKCTTTEPIEKKPVVIQPQLKPVTPRFASEIQAEVKGWIVNKGHGETILHRAARQGCKDVVAYCIERLEYVPSIADNAGYTPLHEACSQGHYEIAKLLLQFGADVSASAQGGIRPLHEAVENGDVHLVRLLLSYGADPKLATYSGQSPLSIATDKQTKMLLEFHMNDIQGTGNVPVWNFDETSLNCEPQFVDRMLWLSPPQSSSENPTFQLEFSEQTLPDVYRLLDSSDDTEWVLFSDVSSALSVKTTEALVKLLDDENATTTIPAARFNECCSAKTPLGYCKPEPPKVVSEESGPIVLVRYDNKIKEMLGVDVYTVS